VAIKYSDSQVKIIQMDLVDPSCSGGDHVAFVMGPHGFAKNSVSVHGMVGSITGWERDEKHKQKKILRRGECLSFCGATKKSGEAQLGALRWKAKMVAGFLAGFVA
jgi:hypothetical protein